MKLLIAFLLAAQSLHHAVAILSFTATPDSIRPGESSTLTWQTRGVESVSIDPGYKTKPLPASGSLVVQPNTTTRYTLNCEADGNYCPALAVTVRVQTPT